MDRGMIDREHMYGKCIKCGLTYDFDYDESPEDEHLDPAGEKCYTDVWDVFLEDCVGDCGVSTHDPNFVPRKFRKGDLPDLSALPGSRSSEEE